MSHLSNYISTSSCTPIGRGSGLRSHKVSVRIRPGAPELRSGLRIEEGRYAIHVVDNKDIYYYINVAGKTLRCYATPTLPLAVIRPIEITNDWYNNVYNGSSLD